MFDLLINLYSTFFDSLYKKEIKNEEEMIFIIDQLIGFLSKSKDKARSSKARKYEFDQAFDVLNELKKTLSEDKDSYLKK